MIKTKETLLRRIGNLRPSNLIQDLKILFLDTSAYVDSENKKIKDYVDEEITGIGPVEAQVQADWGVTATENKAFIKNKPTIPAAQVQADWGITDTASLAFIKNKPTIPTATPVATATVNGTVKRSASVTAIATADATDLDTALVLINELKAKLNAKLASDVASGQQL